MGVIKALNPKSIPKNPKTSKVDVNSLKTEVASFAFSLGLASAPAAEDYGLNDADFRKTRPIKLPKPAKNPMKTTPKSSLKQRKMMKPESSKV
ncbi:hypothetical protein SUGI_0846580 [Cryptomeria japonica]|nr:hypothetical protein SUGI_0846580 [Cryptomeria japonica]